MSVGFAGMGWVTPLGRGIDATWNRLLACEEPTAHTISRDGAKTYEAFLVPPEVLNNLPPHARLRRASAISRFAVAAGLDAIADAKATQPSIDMTQIALVFAVSNGGVTYTKRFYQGIVESGAQAASPLLFPETVFNAPASHLAAILGIEGASYTVVGDAAVGILAIKMAADLLETNAVEYCLVVAAEEADWVLCDAYRKWRLTKLSPPIELFSDPPRGTILSEGAGAVLLGPGGKIKLDSTNAGGNFSHQRNAAKVVRRICHDLRDQTGCVITSANGTFVDLAERDSILEEMPDSTVYSPKAALGESVGASALWQVIVAAQALTRQQLPRMPHVADGRGLRFPQETAQIRPKAVVLTCGLNQQAAGLRLSV